MAILRRILRVLFWLAVSLVGLLVLLVLFVWLLFPWQWAVDEGAAWLEERYGLSVVVGEVAVEPFRSIDLRGVTVAPPEGYDEVVLQVERLRVEYDLSRILSGGLVVEDLRVIRPVIRVIERDGRFNVAALVDGFTRGETGAEPAAPEPAPGEPDGGAGFSLRMLRAAVVDASLDLRHAGGSVTLKGLNLRASGAYDTGASRLLATVKLAPPHETEPNLVVEQGAGEARTGLRARLAVGVRGTLEDLERLQASVLLEGEDISARSGETLALTARDLALLAEGKMDLGSGGVDLSRVSLSLDGDELLAATGRLADVYRDPAVAARVSRMDLDLGRLGELARPFLAGIQADGRAVLRGLDVEGRVSELAAGQLPRAAGELELRGVSLRLPDAGLSLSDLGGRLELSSDAAREPPLQARGRVDAAWLRVSGFRLHRVALTLDGRGTPDGRVASELRLTVARMESGGRKLRSLARGLELDTRLELDPAAGDLTLPRLHLSLPGLCALDVEGQAREMGERVSARIRLAPTDLGRLLVALPPELRRQLPPLRLRGRVALDAKISGRLPARLLRSGRLDPLDLPLQATGTLRLDALEAELDDPALALGGLSGELGFEGTPRAQTVRGGLTLASLAKTDLGVQASGLALEIDAAAEGAALKGTLRLRAGSAGGPSGLAGTGLDARVQGSFADERVQATLKLGLDVLRSTELDLALGGLMLDATASHQLGGESAAQGRLKLRMVQQKAASVSLQDLRLDFDATHAGERSGAEVDLEVAAGRLGAAPLRLEGFGLKGTLAHTESDGLEAQLKLRLESLGHPALGGAPLEGTLADLDVAVAPSFDQLRVRSLTARVPAKGVSVSVKGTAGRFDGVLPEVEAELGLTLDAPRWVSLHGQASVRGKGTLELRLRSPGDGAVDLGGTLGFEGLDASLGGRMKVLGLAGLIPVRQRLRVEPSLALVTGSENVLARKPRDIVYEQLRPYRRGRSGLRLGRLEVAGHTLTDGELDLRIEEGTVALDRVQVSALGGSVVGDLAVQLAEAGSDLRLHAALQATSIDVGSLVGTRFSGAQSQISGGLQLKLGVVNRFLEVDAELTRIGSKMLDRLLRYLDQNGRNQSIVEIRRQLNEYDLSPKLVAARIKHGNLRLDIKMNPASGLGKIAAENIEKISRKDLRRQSIGGLEGMKDLFAALDEVVDGLGARVKARAKARLEN